MTNRDFPRFEVPHSVNVYTEPGGRSSRGRRLGVFAVGLCAGVVALANWRTIVKKGLPWGLKLKTAVIRSTEDLSGIIREAQAECASVAEVTKRKAP